MRTRAMRRKLDARKAIRKAVIAGYCGFMPVPLHYYSKGKVHCSCPLCRSKTNRHSSMFGTCSRRGSNWMVSDIRKLEAMEFQEREFE